MVRFDKFELEHGPGSSNRGERHLFLRVTDAAVTAAGRVDLTNRSESVHGVGCTGCGVQQITGTRVFLFTDIAFDLR